MTLKYLVAFLAMLLIACGGSTPDPMEADDDAEDAPESDAPDAEPEADAEPEDAKPEAAEADAESTD